MFCVRRRQVWESECDICDCGRDRAKNRYLQRLPRSFSESNGPNGGRLPSPRTLSGQVSPECYLGAGGGVPKDAEASRSILEAADAIASRIKIELRIRDGNMIGVERETFGIEGGAGVRIENRTAIGSMMESVFGQSAGRCGRRARDWRRSRAGERGTAFRRRAAPRSAAAPCFDAPSSRHVIGRRRRLLRYGRSDRFVVSTRTQARPPKRTGRRRGPGRGRRRRPQRGRLRVKFTTHIKFSLTRFLLE
ncbi:hypothetical protein EVAR_50125_1 [Eumeta japonica]|uniref:Uncharacterized protein n=1 Tax=Eumeta variegata TaxID=151549 RepID=A0A4C1YTG2_EUMVA|nr:hypothetical protein EVAR_50125_1 [Eumeta japonica]